jgi:CHAT domain-containing protein
VAKLLRPDEALVDILPFTDLPTGTPHLAAIVLAPSQPIAFADLGTSAELSDTINQWRLAVQQPTSTARSIGSISDNAQRGSSQAAAAVNLTDKLNALFIDKIQAHLPKSVRKVWLCPDGTTAKVPWGALSQGLLITEIDTPREFLTLAKSRAPAPACAAVLLVGDIDYKSNSVLNLPSTAQEIRGIAELAATKALPVVTLSKDDATKQSVIDDITKASYGHIATHGFTNHTGTIETASNLSSVGTANLNRALNMGGSEMQGRNPLVDTGLLFAPAPKAADSDHEQTGVLTAEEIVGLDLRKCNLLTLSACQTGLGRAYTGQGLIGLRSAVLSAGARSALMSLWSVPDDATEKLMVEFYKNMWEKNMSKSEALRQAQNSIQNDPTHPQWKQPYYWAAWVLAGDGFN